MKVLQKKKDKKFTILHLTDTHLYHEDWMGEKGECLRNTVNFLVGQAKPDLITISGDLAWTGQYDSYEDFAGWMDGYGIPWAPVFGNHDNQNGPEAVAKAADILLARKTCLLEAGDLATACRRLLVCANEDVGLAYPSIIPIVKAAVDTALQLGMPEARIPLANAVVLVATAPKSNSVYNAINSAMEDVAAGKAGPIPRQLQNKHFDGADAAVKGQHYKYPHSFPNHYVEQQYLPDELKDRRYYTYDDNKTEQTFREYWEKIKRKG